MAATMDRTYSVSVKRMLGEKSGSKVLYDKLLKVNAHEQFVDIADRAGSDVIKPEHVLCTVKASKDEVTFKIVDKHETASILIDMQYRHIVFVYEKVHVQEEVLADGDDSLLVVYFVFWYVKRRLENKKKIYKSDLPTLFFSMLRQSNNFFLRP